MGSSLDPISMLCVHCGCVVGSKIGTLNISMPAPSGPAMAPPTPQQRVHSSLNHDTIPPSYSTAHALPLRVVSD